MAPNHPCQAASLVKDFQYISASESDARTRAWLAANNNDIHDLRKDMFEPIKDTANPSLYVSGPPCPPFSLRSTKCTGFADSRSKCLNHAFKQVVTLLRPKAACIENVAGLLRLKFARKLQMFITSNQRHGYFTAILRACPFGFGISCLQASRAHLSFAEKSLWCKVVALFYSSCKKDATPSVVDSVLLLAVAYPTHTCASPS